MAQIISKNCRLRKVIRFILAPGLVSSAIFCVAGCSVSYPIAGLLDTESTASVKPAEPVAQTMAAAPLPQPAQHMASVSAPSTPSPSLLQSLTGTDLASPAETAQADTQQVDMATTAAIPVASPPVVAAKLKPKKAMLVIPAKRLTKLTETPAQAPKTFASVLDPADIPAAGLALNRALDPKRETQSVAWSNPATGSNGAFVPIADKTAPDSCRHFVTVIRNSANVSGQYLRGTACLDGNGRWNVRDLAPATGST